MLYRAALAAPAGCRKPADQSRPRVIAV